MINDDFNILVLDGGGSKGLYSLGVLSELQKYLGSNLCEHFNLIYGTSTGSIIAALIAIGKPVDDITKLYMKLIPDVMSNKLPSSKSNHLKIEGDKIFEGFDFSNLKTNIGIVSLNNITKEPFIFKSNIKQTHGMKSSFIPGFGQTITDAVLSSSAAYPIFKKVNLTIPSGEEVELVDGGFVANNASLYALVDALQAFKVNKERIKLLSIGTGVFIDKSTGWIQNTLNWIPATKFFTQVFSASTNTNAKLKDLIYPDISSVRINDTFTELKTNMIEKNVTRLNKMYQLGVRSYAKHEVKITKLLPKPAGNTWS